MPVRSVHLRHEGIPWFLPQSQSFSTSNSKNIRYSVAGAEVAGSSRQLWRALLALQARGGPAAEPGSAAEGAYAAAGALAAALSLPSAQGLADSHAAPLLDELAQVRDGNSFAPSGISPSCGLQLPSCAAGIRRARGLIAHWETDHRPWHFFKIFIPHPSLRS